MKVKPVVTKKYVFARKLDGKPIVLDLFDSDRRREKLEATKELFFDLRVHEYLINDPRYAYQTTHEIHVILPKDHKPHTMIVNAGTKFNHKSPKLDEHAD